MLYMVNSPKNIVLFRSDEHNPRYSSPYGHPFVKTPNMDRLAKNGTLFEAAYCNSPLCVPSRSSFFSGKYVHEIQTYNNCQVFAHTYPSYGKILKEQGIHTAYVGKVHTYNKPKKLGFSTMMSKEARKNGDKNIIRKPLHIREGSHKRQYGYGSKVGAATQDVLRVKKAVKWLKKNGKKLNNKNKSWILDINVSKPHFPHHNYREFWDRYEKNEDLPQYRLESETAKHPYAQDLRNHFETHLFEEENIKKMRRGYYGVVSFMDSLLGQVMQTIEEEALLENTLIIYATDHGEMLGKFNMWWKCCLFEDSARIPLIISGPGFERNKRISTPISLLDLQATLFDYFGCKRPEDWRGKSLLKVIGQLDGGDNIAFSEYHGHGTRASAYMVRKEEWKLIYYVEGPNQLFNLNEDPDELNNLVDSEPEITKNLETELLKICDPELENGKAEGFIEKQVHQIEIGKNKSL